MQAQHNIIQSFLCIAFAWEKKDMMSYFTPKNKKADSETEDEDPGVERAEEKEQEVESTRDLLAGETGFQIEGVQIRKER